MTPAADLRLMASTRFTRSYLRATVPLQGLIEGAVQDFVRRHAANPLAASGEYDRLKGFDGKVIKIDVTGGHRLPAHWSPPRLALLDVGDHEILKRYKPVHLAADLQTLAPVPPQFLPDAEDTFFESTPDERYSVYGPELTSEWLYFLSDQQLQALETLQTIAMVSLEKAGQVAFVLGGPGTGKTSILVNLLKWAHEGGLRPKLRIADSVASYVEAVSHASLGAYRAEAEPDLVLVDDPASRLSIERAARATDGERFTVVAFDPCQLDDALSDEHFDRLVRTHSAAVISLTSSYRQKRNVGMATRRAARAVARSTPYIKKARQTEYRAKFKDLTTLANQLEFPNPYGYVKVYEESSPRELKRELDRIRAKPLWRHWPPVIALVDEKVKVPGTWTQLLDDAGVRRFGLNDIPTLKGLEFQHVLLVLNEDLFRQVNTGFTGSGRAEYLRRRLLRIPFSRAKDSLVTFVAPKEVAGRKAR